MASTSTSTAGSSLTSDTAQCHPGGVEALNLKVGPVRRNLFGPVDHQQLDKYLKRSLYKGVDEANKRWNFDFQTDKPGEGSSVRWEELQRQDVPAFYHSCLMRPGAPGAGKKAAMRRLSSLSGQTSLMSTSSSGSDDLDPSPRASYGLRQSRKHQQSAITDEGKETPSIIAVEEKSKTQQRTGGPVPPLITSLHMTD